MRNAIVVVLSLFLVGEVLAQQKPATDADSAHRFVQSFYTWYVPVAKKSPGLDALLKSKPTALEPGLLQALQRDLEAQKKNSEDIVGIDFDPFLYAQDFASRYELGNTSERDGHYFVEVFGVTSGKKSKQPDLVAEVAKAAGGWQFVNFQYPDGTDLRSLLQTLAKQRGDK